MFKRHVEWLIQYSGVSFEISVMSLNGGNAQVVTS